MNTTIESLTEELQILEEIITKAEKSLKNAPEGILRVSKSGNTMQYYKRKDENDRNGKYIKKRDINIARGLAQKEYDKDVLEAAKVQKDKICRFLKRYMPECVIDAYISLPKERQILIHSYILPEEEYVKAWESRTYIGKGFAAGVPEIYTEKGERVRSKSEKILADKFNLMDIPYLYECPLQLVGYGVVYPDFTLLNKRTRKEYYLEHWGRMDDVNYCESAIRKIESYEKSGIFPGEQLLMTYETSKYPLNITVVEQIIHRYLR